MNEEKEKLIIEMSELQREIEKQNEVIRQLKSAPTTSKPLPPVTGKKGELEDNQTLIESLQNKISSLQQQLKLTKELKNDVDLKKVYIT